MERTAAGQADPVSAANLSEIVAIATDGIISVNADQRITLFNQGAARIFGYAPEEVLGESLEILIPGMHRTAHRKHLEEFGKSPIASRRMGERQRISGLRKCGEEFPAEASISKIEIGREQIFTVVIRDVTETVRAHEAERFLAEVGEVLASSLDFDTTLTSIAELTVRSLADICAVDLLDESGATRWLKVGQAAAGSPTVADTLKEGARMNPSLLPLTTETLENGLPRFVSDADRDAETLRALSADELAMLRALDARSFMVLPIQSGDRLLGALLLIRVGGRRFFEAADLSLARDLAVRAGLAVENARLYREARRAVHARDDILGVVSHDLGNPLQAIFIGVEALERAENRSEREDYYLSAIRNSAELMQRMIQDLLEVRRMQEGHLSLSRQPTDLWRLVGSALDVIEPLARVKSIELKYDGQGAELPLAFVDGDRLLQVLSNLIGNAVKHTPEGGRVEIGIEAGDGELEVAVRDSGPGIPEEERPRVFDRFWRSEMTGGRGIGLGLAIAKEIVRAHAGRIWLESEIGEGSTFYFAVPTAPFGSSSHPSGAPPNGG